MKNRSKIIAFTFGIAALSFSTFSCDKDNDSQKSKTELVSQGSWKFSSASASGVDISSSVDDCYKDNIITFNASGGTGNVNEAANVCSSSTAGNFTWSFQNNETEMNVSASLFPGGSGDITIVSLTETTLIVAQDMTISPYPTTTVQVTLVH